MTPDQQKSEIKAEIINLYNVGHLLARLAKDHYSDKSEQEGILQNCVTEMHNDGQINILKLALEIKNSEEYSFFSVQSFYVDVIPSLLSPLDELIEAVNSLVKAAGNDLTGGAPNGAFREWCVNFRRADDVLNFLSPITDGNFFYRKLALEAGAQYDLKKYLALAIADLESDNPLIRKSGAMTLGGIGLSKRNAEHEEATNALMSTVPGANDDVLLFIFRSLGLLHEQSDDGIYNKLVEALEDARRPIGDSAIHEALVWLHTRNRLPSTALVDAVCRIIKDLKPTNLGTIDTLDFGLSQLIAAGRQDDALKLLSRVFQVHGNKIDPEVFKSTTNALLTGEHKVLGRAIILWLLSENRALCDLADAAIKNVGGDPIRLTIDFAKLNLTDKQAVFVCRKAIGYLFFNPVTAASIIVSMLRHFSGDVVNTLVEHLFDPLLLNFSGGVRDYLQEVADDTADKASAKASEAVGQIDDYLAGLRTVGRIREFWPSERERLVENHRHQQLMNDAYAESEKHSVFANLFSKKILLYGNGSIIKVEDPSGQQRRMESKLGTNSFSIESPRQVTIDPFGLDMQLRILRSERFRNDPAD